jgi:hypothetical protein
VKNHVCLFHGVQVVGATWQAAMRIMAGIGDLVQRTRDGQAQVGYSMAGRLGGQVISCVVCTVHVEMRSTGFLVEPQNQGRVSWLSLKTKVDGFLVWAPKLRSMISKLYGSFFFFMIFGVFSSDFLSGSLEEFLFNSFRGFGC